MQTLRASSSEMKSCTLVTSGGLITDMQVTAGIVYIDDNGQAVSEVDTVVFDWSTGDQALKSQIQSLVDVIRAQIAAKYFA